jgi:hypothetical protein
LPEIRTTGCRGERDGDLGAAVVERQLRPAERIDMGRAPSLAVWLPARLPGIAHRLARRPPANERRVQHLLGARALRVAHRAEPGDDLVDPLAVERRRGGPRRIARERRGIDHPPAPRRAFGAIDRGAVARRQERQPREPPAAQAVHEVADGDRHGSRDLVLEEQRAGLAVPREMERGGPVREHRVDG